MAELKANGVLTLSSVSDEVKLAEEDLLIDMSQKAGYVSEADYGITVVLDTNLTEELIEEGYVREIISKVQTMRKEADFEVMDKINIYIANNERIVKILENNKDKIMSEVLANDVIFGIIDGYNKEWNINGEKVTLGVKVI